MQDTLSPERARIIIDQLLGALMLSHATFSEIDKANAVGDQQAVNSLTESAIVSIPVVSLTVVSELEQAGVEKPAKSAVDWVMDNVNPTPAGTYERTYLEQSPAV